MDTLPELDLDTCEVIESIHEWAYSMGLIFTPDPVKVALFMGMFEPRASVPLDPELARKLRGYSGPETIAHWTLAGLNYFEENKIDVMGRARHAPGTIDDLKEGFENEFGVELPNFAFTATEQP